MTDRFPQIRRLATRLREGLAVAVRPRTLVEAIALTVAAWTCLGRGAGWSAGRRSGSSCRSGRPASWPRASRLATAIPSGPGYLGTFELAAVTVGAAIGVSADDAFALALIVHAGILAVTTIGGGLSFLRVGLGSHRASAPASLPAPGDG